jgi:hypothetical protein
MRRIIVIVLVTIVTILGLGTAVVAGGGSDSSTVTRARLERSLPLVFSNLYVDQARLLGRPDLTPQSLNAQAMCDKHGPDVADVGPGGDWICLMSWSDPKNPMPPEGYGKFELNVHSNDCYTAAGPTKLTGFLTLTDAHGREVTNPVFEFDGCFDPNGDDTATGVVFPSVLNVTSTTLSPDADGQSGLQVTCGTGSDGCSGSVTATADEEPIGTMQIHMKEESTATLALPKPVPAGADDVTFDVELTTGVGPTSPVTLPVQGQ